MAKRPYTAREMEFICDHYADRGPAWVAEKLDRPVSSVEWKAGKLGVQRPYCRFQSTPEIDAALRQLYPDPPRGAIKQLEVKLGLHRNFLYRRARDLGLVVQGFNSRCSTRKSKRVKRICLRCDRPFMSAGDRICSNCHEVNAAIHLPAEHGLCTAVCGTPREMGL